MVRLQPAPRHVVGALTLGLISVGSVVAAHGSDHLDTPTVAMNPRADIGDLYAWRSPSGRQLNLVMTIVDHAFSEEIVYAFHVDSGKKFGETTGTTTIECRFPAANTVQCRAGDDQARGDAGAPDGLQSRSGRFRVFAGTRDDPFFNNVRGTRAAYQVAALALKNGAAADAAGCPAFDKATTQSIRSEWRRTDGGPGTNFLAGWTPASLVVSIDLDAVASHGPLLAVWATTSSAYGQLDRVGRPLTGNALLALFAPADVSDRLKEQYNRAAPATAAGFVAEIGKSLAMYDGFDGKCGNQFLAGNKPATKARYEQLATLLADDRLWVNSASGVCTQLFAVERAHLAGQRALDNDCGGRTPNYSAVNVYRSLLVDGTVASMDDGLDHDEREPSPAVFPFLAAPDAAAGAASVPYK